MHGRGPVSPFYNQAFNTFIIDRLFTENHELSRNAREAIANSWLYYIVYFLNMCFLFVLYVH